MNYSEVEAKVREATNDDTWGPHGSLMTEISKYTFTYEHYPEVMSMVWKRMFETKKNWRRTYKVRKRRVYCASHIWQMQSTCFSLFHEFACFNRMTCLESPDCSNQMICL